MAYQGAPPIYLPPGTKNPGIDMNQGSPPFNPHGPKQGGPGPRPPAPSSPGPRPIGPKTPTFDAPYPDVSTIPAPQAPPQPEFDRDAFLRNWMARRQQRIPLNTGGSGPGTLPPPMIKPGISQAPPGMDRSGGKPYQEPSMYMGARPQIAPGSSRGGFTQQQNPYLPPQYQQMLSAMQQGQGQQAPAQQEFQDQGMEKEDQMPAWMRARLRRNPGGGGQLGNRGGGGMQAMPVGVPQPSPQVPQGGVIQQGMQPRVGMGAGNPYANGFEFFNY